MQSTINTVRPLSVNIFNSDDSTISTVHDLIMIAAKCRINAAGALLQ